MFSFQANKRKHCMKKIATALSLWPVTALNKPQLRESLSALEKPILLLPLSWRNRLGFVSLRRHKKTQPSILPYAHDSQGIEVLASLGTADLCFSSVLERLKEQLCASYTAQLAAALDAAVISYPAEWEASVITSLTHFQEAVWQAQEVFANFAKYWGGECISEDTIRKETSCCSSMRSKLIFYAACHLPIPCHWRPPYRLRAKDGKNYSVLIRLSHCSGFPLEDFGFSISPPEGASSPKKHLQCKTPRVRDVHSL